MKLKIRQRLIGFILLILLAAILAPLVLRSPHQMRVALDRTIPEPPQASVPPPAPVISDAQQKQLNDTIDQDRQQVARTAAAPDKGSAQDEKPAGKNDGQPEETSKSTTESPARQAVPQAGFTVQVASFADAGNAEALVKRLKEAGYSAYRLSVSQGDKPPLQRVFIGPEIKRERAEALRDRLAKDKRFQLPPGLVRSYVP